MSDHKRNVFGFLGIILLLFVAWVVSGGPDRAKQTGNAYNPFQNPIQPISNGGTYRQWNP